MKISSFFICTVVALMAIVSYNYCVVDAAFPKYFLRLLMNNPSFGGYSILITSLLRQEQLKLIRGMSEHDVKEWALTENKDSSLQLTLSSNCSLRLGDVLLNPDGHEYFYIQKHLNNSIQSVLINAATGISEVLSINNFSLSKPQTDLDHSDYSAVEGVNDIFVIYNSTEKYSLLKSSAHQFVFSAPKEDYDSVIRKKLQNEVKDNKVKPPLRIKKTESPAVEVDEYPSTMIPFKGLSPSFDEAHFASPDSVTFMREPSGIEYYFRKVEHNYEARKKFIKTELVPMLLEQKLSAQDAMAVISTVKKVLSREDTVQRLDINYMQSMFVVGDIHGQLQDLLRFFETLGWPGPFRKYLFNGDFVDRGEYSLECLILLYALKITLPESVFLNRGNHESRMCGNEKFYRDCMRMDPSGNLFNSAQESFKFIPLAATIRDRIYVVHAGIRGDFKVSEMRKIDRTVLDADVPTNEFFLASLWWDPSDENGVTPNLARMGRCNCFGPDETQKFLQLNNLDHIIRSHMVNKTGVSFDHQNRCLTLFSAPNYSNGYFGNDGAVLEYNSKLERKEYRFS